MNTEETKRAIEVMQAYVDGKNIEWRVRRHVDWKPGIHFSWDWYTTEYRINPPKPRECYVLFDSGGSPLSSILKVSGMHSQFILMREVIEERGEKA